jgi:dTDP-4-amino-4,6-dideoxygalactose transaminase
MDLILNLAKKYNLKIVEDCAQALSAEYKGNKVGSLGDVGCLSFFPSKNLGAFGDCGMVVTNNLQIAEKTRMLRQHGQKTSYFHILPGFNSRLDAMQATILRVKLKYLDSWSDLRRKRAELYNQLLAKLEGIEPPYVAPNRKTSANYYTVRLRNHNVNRNDLRKFLSSRGIDSAIYYPLSLHLQEAYGNLGYKPGDYPESELAQEQVLSFPMYPEISETQVQQVVENVKEYLKAQV